MPWNRLIYLMYDTKSRITFPLSIYDYPHGKKVIYLFKFFVLRYHLFVDAEIMLCPAIDSCFYTCLFDMFIYLGNYLLDKFLSPAPALVYPLNKVVIYIRLKIFESKIIKFNFNFRNTKSVCDRCIDIECLP